MLFKLDSRNNAVLYPDAFRMFPGFKNLTKEETLFLVLYCDYRSPYHQFPDHDRLLKSKRHVWGSDVEVTKKLEKAMEEYLDLQYDSRREMIKTYQRKIQLMNKALFDEETPSKIKSISDAMDNLQDKCEKIQRDLDFDELKMASLLGSKKKSLLEQLQERKKLSELKDHEYPEISIVYEPIETGE